MPAAFISIPQGQRKSHRLYAILFDDVPAFSVALPSLSFAKPSGHKVFTCNPFVAVLQAVEFWNLDDSSLYWKPAARKWTLCVDKI
jgi:hypothetical protein